MAGKNSYNETEYYLDELSTIASDISSVCTEPTECTIIKNPLYGVDSMKQRTMSITSVSTIETEENDVDTHSRNVSTENSGLRGLYSEDIRLFSNMFFAKIEDERKLSKENVGQKIENRYK
jgi:hypothetical protein